MRENLNEWTLVSDESPGYLGSKREATFVEWNQRFGNGNWQQFWIAGKKLLDFLGACRLYEDAYVKYFSLRPELLTHICEIASDVYDDYPSNVDSGCNYLIQETEHTHIQDIAIRNSLLRLGRKFRGTSLVQIRDAKGKTAISKALSPGQVPFHLPLLISTPTNLEAICANRWWLPHSVEDFYQRNKRLAIRK
jgi:hypothetical protein